MKNLCASNCGTSAEERLECFIHATQGVSRATDILNADIFGCTNLSQLLGLVIIRDALALPLIRFGTFL
jgi:hypothetical protein